MKKQLKKTFLEVYQNCESTTFTSPFVNKAEIL